MKKPTQKVKKIKFLNTGEEHEFVPSDARDLCQICNEWEEYHYPFKELTIRKINELVDAVNSLLPKER